MGELSGIKHDLAAFKNSCTQEMSRCESELRESKRSYADLKGSSGFYKVFKSSKYKERKTSIEEKIRELEERLKALAIEMEVYKKYGLDVPQNIPNYQLIKELIEDRERRLDVIMLVEMNLM